MSDTRPGLPGISRTESHLRTSLHVKDTLVGACGRTPGVLCRVTFDATHDGRAASFVRGFVADPLNLLGKILLVVVLAWIARRIAHRMLSRMVLRAAESTVPDRLRNRPLSTAHAGSEALLSERRRQRAHTTGSVLRSISTVLIYGVAGIMILGDLGLDLAPILASAGIMGVAVGFGAQNLVKDFLSGMFMILEDQYGVGDVISVGDASGTVEAVTLRTLRLRDVNGVVWYVRNGEITKVGNESQGWARAIVDLPVAYDSELERVKSLLADMAEQLWRDPEWSSVLVEQPEVWGVESLSGAAMVVRLATKTAPLEQWNVARELRQRAKRVLDAEGVVMTSA